MNQIIKEKSGLLRYLSEMLQSIIRSKEKYFYFGILAVIAEPD